MKIGDIVYYAKFSKHWWYMFSEKSISECRVIDIKAGEYGQDVIRAAGLDNDVFFTESVYNENEVVEHDGECICFSTDRQVLYNKIKKEIAKSIGEIITVKELELSELKEKFEEFNSDIRWGY